MYRYRFSSTKNTNESAPVPEKNDQNKIKTEPINKESNIPSKYTSYHNIRNYRKSEKKKKTKNQNKNVTPTENNITSKEFVNKSKYRSTKTSQPTQSETAKNYRDIKTNEIKEQSQQVPPAFKRRSYFLPPKENNLKENIKDYKRSSSNEKIKKEQDRDIRSNNENKKENNIGKRYFRRFRNTDNSENNENKNDGNTEESGTSNSNNLNISSRNKGFTTGRLVNDSNENLIKIDKDSKNK